MHVNPGEMLPIPEANQWIGYKMNHLDLLARPEVYQQIRRWLAPEQLPNEQLP
ncbi:MAG: hypothetical protein IPI73_16120 [Betaproteobacteria bacterium]|nr:hypothetical protein [Betaproteobacteria bacterium]